MNEAVEAVDTIFRITLSGITYALRIADEVRRQNSADNKVLQGYLASLQQAQEQGKAPTRGQVKIEEMLQRGKGLAQFNLMERDSNTFISAAKEAGLTYALVSMDTKNEPGQRILTVFVSKEDVYTVNNIITLNDLNAVQEVSIEQEEVPPEEVPQEEAPVEDGLEETDIDDYGDPQERRQMQNDLFLEHIIEREKQRTQQEVQEKGEAVEEEKELNPTNPENLQKETPSESVSGKKVKQEKQKITPAKERPQEAQEGGFSSQMRNYTSESQKAENEAPAAKEEDIVPYQGERRQSIKQKIKELEEKNKKSAAASRDEKDRVGFAYINEMKKGESELGGKS